MGRAKRRHAVSAAGDRIQEEHGRVRDVIRVLGEAPDLVELLRRLEDFRAAIMPHFAAEEEPGGFFDVVAGCGNLDLGRIQQLRQDHWAFLAEIDRLGEAARACLRGPVAEVLRQAADLARRVQEHEAREVEVLGDALYNDSGEGD